MDTVENEQTFGTGFGSRSGPFRRRIGLRAFTDPTVPLHFARAVEPNWTGIEQKKKANRREGELLNVCTMRVPDRIGEKNCPFVFVCARFLFFFAKTRTRTAFMFCLAMGGFWVSDFSLSTFFHSNTHTHTHTHIHFLSLVFQFSKASLFLLLLFVWSLFYCYYYYFLIFFFFN